MKKILFGLLFAISAMVSIAQVKDKPVEKMRSFLYSFKHKVDDKWETQNFTKEHLVVVDYANDKISVYGESLIDEIDILPKSFTQNETDRFMNFLFNGVDNSNKECKIKICFNKATSSVFYISFDFGNYVRMYYHDK